jgi:hypothetical protein
MDLSRGQQNKIAKTELAYYPRGPRGSDQNIMRMGFVLARRNALGRKAQIARNVDASHEVALRAVRRGNPDFAPVCAEPTLTTDDIERYLSQYLAAQSVAALAPDFPRWLRRLAKQGVGDVPLVLGSESAQWIDLFVLQASSGRGGKQAHDMRDTLPALRPYKGPTGQPPK